MPRVRAENTSEVPLWSDDYRGGVEVSHQGFRTHSYEKMMSGAAQRDFGTHVVFGQTENHLGTAWHRMLARAISPPRTSLGSC